MQRSLLGLAMVLVGCGGGGASTSDAGPASDAPAAHETFADQVTLSEIASFQTVKVGLMKDGADIVKTNAPIVSDRATLLRAYVTVAKKWKPATLDAELDVTVDGRTYVFTDSKTISRSSSDDSLASTFDFSLPEALVHPTTAYALKVWRDDTGEELDYPTDGTTRTLPASDGGAVHVVIVPIRYDADSSQRLPNLSDTMLARYHDTLYSMYPTSLVKVDVHEALPWAQVIDPLGPGWDEVLTAVAELRSKEAPAPNAYYVAAFEPADSINAFCKNGGCILGIAPLAGPNDVDLRVAAVLGYSGQLGPNTLLQELAHAMGRDHADCGGADGVDPAFPYPGAGIGNWGYDIVAKELVDPATVSDFMGYCSPVWISDYTYKGLFKRITYVSQGVDETPWMSAGPTKTSQRVLHVAADGSVRVGRTLKIAPPQGSTRSVTVRGRRFDAPYVPLDHGGGMIFVPDETGLDRASITVDR